MQDEEEERLIAKLRKIEALFARATNAGERAAAENARDRIRGRLEQLEKSERAIEYRFALPDGWSKSLFIALLRRYGIESRIATAASGAPRSWRASRAPSQTRCCGPSSRS